MPNKSRENKRRGPKEDRLKLDGPWDKAIGKALLKARPKKKWPRPVKKKPT